MKGEKFGFMSDVVVKLLWTGGFDSTYRLCELVYKGIKVEPYYVLCPGRESIFFEMEAHKNILKFLSDKGYSNFILPIKYCNLNDIKIDESIKECYYEVIKEHFLVGQTMFLSAFSKINKGIELCNEKKNNDFNHFVKAEMTLLKNDVGSYVLDKDKSSKRAVLLFGDFSFPILDKDNLKMYNDLVSWGFSEVFNLVRFCSSSTKEPCGLCLSCFNKLREGLLDYRFSKLARKRFYVYSHLRKIDCRGKQPYSEERYFLAELYSFFITYGVIRFLKLREKLGIDNKSFINLCSVFHNFDNFTTDEIKKFFRLHKSVNDFLK